MLCYSLIAAVAAGLCNRNDLGWSWLVPFAVMLAIVVLSCYQLPRPVVGAALQDSLGQFKPGFTCPGQVCCHSPPHSRKELHLW